MPKLRLGVLRRTTSQLQQCGVGSPKRMPAYPRNACELASGLENAEQQVRIVKGCSLARREDQLSVYRQRRKRPHDRKRQRYFPLASLCLWRAHAAPVIRSLDVQLSPTYVYILPPQCQDFTDPKTRQDSQEDHGSNRLRQYTQEPHGLSRHQNALLPHTLLFRQFNAQCRINAREMPPFHGTRVNLRQQIAQVMACFPAQSPIEFLQDKTLHLDGPHVTKTALAEARNKVKVQG